jgi:FMN reductase
MVNDEPRLAVVVGHPSSYSRTHAVALRAGRRLRQALGDEGVPLAGPQLIDLAELAPGLLGRNGRNGHGDAADTALHTVRQVPLVLTASPTFRGACSGLLKLFLDLLPRNGLEGTIVVPLMTAGIPAHRRAVDTSLRPVLLELRAQVPTAGISVLETEFARFDDIFDAWWAAQGPALSCAVGERTRGRADEVTSC